MARKPKKYHYIYKTTCKLTGKFYVGMHSSDSLDDGYLGSGKILGYSRKKYGDENHVREILEFCSSRDELKQREKEIVNEALLADPLNINLKYGGEGGGKIWSDQHRIKFLTAKRDLIASARKTAATKKLRSLKDAEYAQNIKNGCIKGGSQTARLYPQLQKIATLAAMSPESIEKKKVTFKERGHMVGVKNSQYGTCWVHKDSTIVKIKSTQLEEYLARGYHRGRKTFSPL